MFAALSLISVLGLLLYHGMSGIEWILARRFPNVHTGPNQI
jgi:hypothetical protein